MPAFACKVIESDPNGKKCCNGSLKRRERVVYRGKDCFFHLFQAENCNPRVNDVIYGRRIEVKPARENLGTPYIDDTIELRCEAQYVRIIPANAPAELTPTEPGPSAAAPLP